MDEKTLKRYLEAFPGATDVEVQGGRKLIARVVVPAWDGVDEADRQEALWTFLRSNITEAELGTIEFILTDAPADAA